MSVLLVAIFLTAAGTWAWTRHARAWGLGPSSPVLAYDAAQYALAARELAEHGRFATPFALPLELAHHPTPPWPLALVQPGLVVAEAVLFRLAPGGSAEGADLAVGPPRAWLVLVLPVLSFFACALLLGLGAMRLLSRFAPHRSALERALAGALVGLCFLLDPDAQHFAIGGFTELPFTLGLTGAMLAIATGMASRRPLIFGLLLGVTGSFRGNMLWLAPVLAAAAAASDAPGRRLKVLAQALVGFCLPLAPWWIYKWREFGSPGWDLSWISLWDGIGGRTWFSLNHLPELPDVPSGAAAVGAIAAKVSRNLPGVILDLTIGPRGLWIAALFFWTIAEWTARPKTTGEATEPQKPEVEASPMPTAFGGALGSPTSRALVAAGIAALGVLGLSAIVTAASVPLSRYLFPMRIAVAAAGILALWGLITRAPAASVGPRLRRGLQIGVAVLAVLWGLWQTAGGWAEGRAAATARGVPSTPTMIALARSLERELRPDEPVMSNLGPVLAWYLRRPVVHLALSPEDVDACRRRLELRHVLLVFRAADRAWPDWTLVMERPQEAALNPDWNIRRAQRSETADGFQVVWLELGPLEPRLASSSGENPSRVQGRFFGCRPVFSVKEQH